MVNAMHENDSQGPEGFPGYGSLIGASASIRRVFDSLRMLQNIDTPTVLVTGESGTGKDLVARSVHALGLRRLSPFVEVDCTTIPENLVESTLFGHEKGAFTGATRQHSGLFEVAEGGVVFLDEVGELPLATQAKLLRGLENRRFKRVGGTRDLSFSAQVIAATNRDLAAEVRSGRFREDLYYRLSVIPVQMPALRERGADIDLLVRAFVTRSNEMFGRQVRGFTLDAQAALRRYTWPGNVRELRNVVERCVIFARQEEVLLRELPPPLDRVGSDPPAATVVQPQHTFLLPSDGCDLERVERELIEQAMARSEGNQSAAARLVGLDRFALRNRLKRYGMLRPARRRD